MSKIDLYPTTTASPKDAKVATGTGFSANKVGLDTNILGGFVVTGTASAPADYDQANVTYPNAVTEVYVYRKLGVIVKTVTITYTNASKDNISGWTIT